MNRYRRISEICAEHRITGMLLPLNLKHIEMILPWSECANRWDYRTQLPLGA